MRLRKMIIIVIITNNNFNCVALFKINLQSALKNPPKNQVVVLVRIIKNKIKHN